MAIFRESEAVALLSSEAHGAGIVVCPSCGSSYTDVLRVGTLVGTDQHEAVPSYEGTSTTGSTPGRRSALEVVFWCEGCDNYFALVIQQDKGVSRVEIHSEVESRKE